MEMGDVGFQHGVPDLRLHMSGGILGVLPVYGRAGHSFVGMESMYHLFHLCTSNPQVGNEIQSDRLKEMDSCPCFIRSKDIY